MYEDDGQLRVRLIIDKEKQTLTISDNGIGLTRDQAIEHLGTIAKSGTAEFFSHLSGDQSKDSQLIGQFGVGFYSAFIVADRVTVLSRAAGVAADQGVSWESDGSGSFPVATIHKAGRGTDVILHLKADESEFLDDWRLRSVIGKYSDHISSIPVELWEQPSEQKDTEGEQPVSAGEGGSRSIVLLHFGPGLPVISRMKSIKEFYKHISHDFEAPLAWAHNKVEGSRSTPSLLYVPARAPWDLWNQNKKTV